MSSKLGALLLRKTALKLHVTELAISMIQSNGGQRACMHGTERLNHPPSGQSCDHDSWTVLVQVELSQLTDSAISFL